MTVQFDERDDRPMSAPVDIRPAEGKSAPVVFDSPHSGTDYPSDFHAVCPMASLRSAEDTFVDELFGAAPWAGAAFIVALFPRSYIDVNRSLDDIDQELLAAPWPDPIAPSEKARLGKGLVWRNLNSGESIYDRRLTVEEMRRRVDRYYRPYHAALDQALDAVRRTYGFVYHIDCHSMPARVVTEAYPNGVDAADFVLGDRDGTSCEPGLTEVVENHLISMGYKVARNDPYKGVELVRRHGRPGDDRHSLQIEVNRALYLTDDFQRSSGFAVVQKDLTSLIGAICAYARSRTQVSR